VLLNGASGIAVGMSTDIPPHNLREVVAACIHLLENPRATLDELLEARAGRTSPPARRLVSPPAEIRAIYETGNGTLRLRACWEREEGEIVVTALPWQVSGSKVLEQIAAQMRAKKLPMVEDLRDESDHENPTRLVIVPRSNRVDVRGADGAPVRHHRPRAHAARQHERHRPRRAASRDGPAGLLSEWLEFRLQTVTRRLQYRLDRVEARLHVLEGLLVAYLNIDEVIRIIRSEDEPKPVLMSTFGLSDAQAEAILELKLRHLAKLEEMKIRGEQDELVVERDHLQKTLGSKARLNRLLREELAADAERHGDERRTRIVTRAAAQALDESALLPAEPVTIVLSQRGWVRAAKGHDIDPQALSYRSGDGFLAAAQGRSNQAAMFLDSTGRVYSLPAHGLPSARGQGEPLSGRLNPPDGASFAGTLIGDGEDRWLLAASDGYGFVARLEELQSRNRSGKHVLKVARGAAVLRPCPVPADGEALVAAVSSAGRLLCFPAAELPELARGRGNKLLGVDAKKFAAGEEAMIAALVVPPGSSLKVLCGQRTMTLKPRDLEGYLAERARRGALLPRGWRKVDDLALEA
jgi:topoisomerase IV subunit A